MVQALPETRYYFGGRCLFCNKNNRKRQTRRGRYWKCRHCGETNPGPGMMKAMVSHMTQPPADPKHINGAVSQPKAEPTQPAAVAMRIKGIEQPSPPTAAAVKPTPTVAAKPKPKPKPVAPPEKKPGVLERLWYG